MDQFCEIVDITSTSVENNTENHLRYQECTIQEIYPKSNGSNDGENQTVGNNMQLVPAQVINMSTENDSDIEEVTFSNDDIVDPTFGVVEREERFNNVNFEDQFCVIPERSPPLRTNSGGDGVVMVKRERENSDKSIQPFVAVNGNNNEEKLQGVGGRSKSKYFVLPEYRCHVCGEALMNAGQIESHFRQHPGEKPFICEVCQKGYGSIPSLILFCTISIS